MMKKWWQSRWLPFLGGVVSIALMVFVSAVWDTSAQMQVVRDNTVRLHILANSDSASDQQIKLKVRNALLQNTATWFEECQEKEDVLQVLRTRQGEIAAMCQDTLQQLDCPQTVSVQVDREWFNTRNYTDFCMPSGDYDCVRIVLGAGEGHNWWCVLYPQLCIASAGKVDPYATYGEDGVRTICRDDITVSFKIVDWLNQLLHIVRQII